MSGPGDYVVLLHGIGRSKASMASCARAAAAADYVPVNLDYPSRRYDFDTLAGWLADALATHCPDPGKAIHFITHSMGGVLLRLYLTRHRPPNLGRVVMLAPPNHGSEIVDLLKGHGVLNDVFKAIFGPAGQQLGTPADADSIIRALGPVDYPVGVIIGKAGLNPVRVWLFDTPSDGTVTVESSKVEGMVDHLVLDASHSFIMYSSDVISQAMHFLAHGHFERDNFTRNNGE